MKYNIQTITYLFDTFIGLNESIKSHEKCAKQFKQQVRGLVKINQLSSDDVDFVLEFLHINTYDITYILPKTQENIYQFKNIVAKLAKYNTKAEKADILNQLKQQKVVNPLVFKFVVRFYDLEGVSIKSKATLYDEVVSELRRHSAYIKVVLDKANNHYLYCYWACLTNPKTDEEKFAIMLLQKGNYFEVISKHSESRSCGGPEIIEKTIPDVVEKMQTVGLSYFIEGNRPKDRTQVMTTTPKKRTSKPKTVTTTHSSTTYSRPSYDYSAYNCTVGGGGYSNRQC